ncbi:U4/U6-U5 snRNP complex subunit dib1 [Vanrija albida]|uniref:U4/U6-U5 snRNP complex subunit dib1 n=1 Tax=Vanrija albida TaxID=181172 RepID=A0ABR3PSS2_9TREE
MSAGPSSTPSGPPPAPAAGGSSPPPQQATVAASAAASPPASRPHTPDDTELPPLPTIRGNTKAGAKRGSSFSGPGARPRALSASRVPPGAESALADDDDDDDEGHEIAPLPDVHRSRSMRTSFGAGAKAAARPRAFSSGAAASATTVRKRAASAATPDGKDGIPPAGASSPPPAFVSLGPTVSRMSSMSARTFVDPVALVSMPTLTREETRTMRRARARAGTVTTMASLARMVSPSGTFEEKPAGEDEEGVEELVAVQITDDGEEIVYPDGGVEAWSCLFGGVCAALCAFGLAASVGAFQSYYRENLLEEYPASTIAWIGSAQAAICFGMCIFTGPLFDRYGCRPLLATGTLLLVLAFCMLSLSTKYYQIFLCHATLMALGADLMFIVPMGAVGQWFFLKRGLAFGILMTGSSAGAIIWPAIIANLPQRIGWGWTMRLIALLMGILGVLATLFVKTRLPPRPPGPFFHLSEFRNPAYAFVAASFPFLVFGFFSFLTFIGTYGSLAGLGDFSPYLLMITNGSSGVGRLVFGFSADLVGTFNVAIVGIYSMAILTFGWLGMKTAPPLIALCVLYGFMSGAPVSVQGPMVTAAATDPRLAGTLIGQALMVQSIAQLSGPPIFGAIVGAGSPAQQFANFPKAIAFGGCMLFISGTLVLAARLSKTKKLFAII